MIIDEEVYLTHYGVKGQKWGVINKFKKWNDRRRISIEANKLKSGNSQAQAKKQAAGQLKVENVLLAAGGLAVAGLIGYRI